ncbi:MAG: class I SAM-dependent methyltransferase [candidate division WOR-3 bacterium]
MGKGLRPFEKFAFYYDSFMKELVDYERWVNYTIKIWQREGKAVRSVLDLACGTGIPSLLLAKKGFWSPVWILLRRCWRSFGRRRKIRD